MPATEPLNERDELLNKLDQLLWFHFPDDPLGGGPNWVQEPYRENLFGFCRRALGLVDGDVLADYVRSHWNIRRQYQLTAPDSDRLYQLMAAWHEWQYAMCRLEKRGQQ